MLRALLTASVISVALSCAPPPGAQAQSGQINQSAKTEQRGSPSAPVVVQFATTPRSQQQSDRAADDAHRQARENGALVWITGILAFLAACQWVALVWQGWQMKRAAVATAKAAKAATASADALPALERAYMYLGRVSPVARANWPGQVNGTIEGDVTLTFNNYGRTPAILQTVRCAVVGLDRLPVRADIMELPDDTPTTRAVSAGESYDEEFSIVLRGDCVPSLSSIIEAKIPFLIGLLEYRDVFGISNETCFCWSYDWIASTFVERGAVPEMNFTRPLPAHI